MFMDTINFLSEEASVNILLHLFTIWTGSQNDVKEV